MLKTISTLLITTTLFSNCYGSDLERPNQSLSHAAETPYHGEWVTQPASVEELEDFFKSNYGEGFPEESWESFINPLRGDFKKKSQSMQKAIKKKAKNAISIIVSVFWRSFAESFRPKDIELSDLHPDNLGDDLLSRCLELNNLYFLCFQDKLMKLLALFPESKSILSPDNHFGVCESLNFFWLKDKHGIVPAPRLIKSGLDHVPFLYGDWGDDFKRSVFFEDGKHIASAGVYVYMYPDNLYCRVSLEFGSSQGYKTHNIAARISLAEGEGETLLKNKVLKKTIFGGAHAFMPFPETSREDAEFEAALLERIMEESQKSDQSSFANTVLKNYGDSLNSLVEELPDDSKVMEVETEALQPSITPMEAVKRRTDKLYEEMIREELESRSQAAEDTAGLKSVKKKTQASAHQSTKSKTAANLTDENASKAKAADLEAQKAEILSKLKTQGRQKWGSLINIIMSILTPHVDKLEFNTKGSHFKIHIKGQKESAGMTLITPHGRKGGEVPAGVARNLALHLFDLIAKTSAE